MSVRPGARALAAVLFGAVAAVGAAPPSESSGPAGEPAHYRTNEVLLPNLYSLKRKIQWEGSGGYRVVQSEHFDVVVRESEQELGLRIAAIAEPWFEELKARYGVDPDSRPAHSAADTTPKPPERIPLIAYTSMNRFQETNTVPGFLPEGVQGFFEFIKGRIVLPHTGSNTLLAHVTRHEIVHAFSTRLSEREYGVYQAARRLARDRRTDWSRLSYDARRIAKGTPRGTFPAFFRANLHPKGTAIGLANRAAIDAAREGRALLAPRVYVGWPQDRDGYAEEGARTVSVEAVGAVRVGALAEPGAFDSLCAAVERLPDSSRVVVRRLEWARHWEIVGTADTLFAQPPREAALDTAGLRAALARAVEPPAGRWARRVPEVAFAAPSVSDPARLAAAAAALLPAYATLSAIPLENAPRPWPPEDESYDAAEDSLFRWVPPSLKPRLLPLALNEGSAEYFGSDWDALEEMVLRDALLSNRLVPINRLGYQHGYLVYVEGESFLRWLAGAHGADAVAEFLRRIYLGPSMSGAARAVFGKNLSALSSDWEEAIRKRIYSAYGEQTRTTDWAKQLTEGPFDTAPRASGPWTLYKRARRGRTEIVLRSVDSTGADRSQVIAKDRRPGSESLHLLQNALDVRGDRAAYGVQEKGHDLLRIVDLPSGRTAAEFGWPAVLSITGISIAPGGRRVAFTALDDSGHADLFVAALDSGPNEPGNLERLTDDLYEELSPSWGERGILFTSDRESAGSQDVYRIDPDDGTRTIDRITRTPWNETEPAWLPGETEFLALDDRDSTPQITRIDAETGAAQALTRDRVGVAHVSADSNRIVVSAFRGLRMRLWETSLDSLLADSVAAVPIGAPADSAAAADSLVAWSPAPQPIHALVKYRPRYGADLLLVNATSLSTGGYFGVSDLLGNRQIALILGSNAGSSESFVKFLNVGAVYSNLEGRNDWRVGVLRTGNEFLTQKEGFFFERDTGILFGMTHPLDRFRSVSWDLIANAVSRETFDSRPDKTAELSLQTIFGHDTAVPDDYGYGYGSGLLTSLLVSLDYRVTSPFGWRSVTGIYDLRNYIPIAGQTFLAMRASVGASTGRVPDRIRLGGSWTLRGYRFNQLQGNRFALGNLELRFPLPVVVSVGGVPIIRAVQGALFGDIGDAWFAPSTVTLKGSVGIGFRMGLAGTVFRYDISKRYDERNGGFQDGTRGDLFIGYNF